MASTKKLRIIATELDKVLGIVKGRADNKLPALDGLKGGDLAAALLEEAKEIYTTDEISDETTKILTELGWKGPIEPPVIGEGDEDDGTDGDTKSNLPLPNVEDMDHDDLLEELEFTNTEIPVKLRKETTKTLITLRALVEKHRPIVSSKKKEKASAKKETATKDKKSAEKKTPAEKKEKAPKKKQEVNAQGHRPNTMTGVIDTALAKGTTEEAAVATIVEAFPDKTKTAAAKFQANTKAYRLGKIEGWALVHNEKKGTFKIKEVE